MIVTWIGRRGGVVVLEDETTREAHYYVARNIVSFVFNDGTLFIRTVEDAESSKYDIGEGSEGKMETLMVTAVGDALEP